ncbi:MAG TPA: DNA methyltransferase [Chthonomonas sp.]|uniref:TRM11 family SAM-dependent methyltransferase n=1 Tax=Chthonomonas sp. TaxID=2282153 RepID=UPI002B4AD570|nr:DNA methyltransferase [Chthonomonas sp.]HLI48556.1 DNA methyltransferase [Chthonomonas sp.]
MSDQQVGILFGLSFKQLENLITQTYSLNVSLTGGHTGKGVSDLRPKPIKAWAPAHFQLETTSVWSYKQRGNWATHDGRYRGNWSPYIPRNLILRYTHVGELVLDPFAGGGTTAVEAKLLGRRCLARDINPASVQLTLQNLNFNPPSSLFTELPIYEPEVSVGDARHLLGIPDDSIDLICAHPPYAGIISYSDSVQGDLSNLDRETFLLEMQKVAAECFRVLRPGKMCAVLIGDARYKKYVVPIGFDLIEVFLKRGFLLKELVIKRQHNCKTTGFWTEKSLQHNFLLLAHEYLPIFEKPNHGVLANRIFSNHNEEDGELANDLLTNTKGATHEINRHELLLDNRPTLPCPTLKTPSFPEDGEHIVEGNLKETTTVWISSSPTQKDAHGEFVLPKSAVTNLVMRYGNVRSAERHLSMIESDHDAPPLTPKEYRLAMRNLADAVCNILSKGDFFVVHTKDIRVDNCLIPLAQITVKTLAAFPQAKLKEIIVVSYPDIPLQHSSRMATSRNELCPIRPLDIVHSYLLVYEVAS